MRDRVESPPGICLLSSEHCNATNGEVVIGYQRKDRGIAGIVKLDDLRYR